MGAFSLRTLLIVIILLINEYHLKGALAKRKNPCRDKPCENGGVCKKNKKLELWYYCQCVEGFEGYNCETVVEPCKDAPCNNGGECILNEEEEKGFHCECVDFYTGETCDEKADLCAQNPCYNGGECVIDETVGVGFRCNCIPEYPGYVGEFCDIYVDENGCRTGYQLETWNFQTRDHFTTNILHNNYNYDPALFEWILNESYHFLVLKGKDSLQIASNNNEYPEFYVQRLSIETREIRRVIFDFRRETSRRKVRTFITERVDKAVKGKYTISATSIIPRGGYEVRNIVVNFLTTPGVNPELGLKEKNAFWVRNAELVVCVPSN